MAPGGEMFRYPKHYSENELRHGSHEWLPYSKDEVRLKSLNNNLPAYPLKPAFAHTILANHSPLTMERHQCFLSEAEQNSDIIFLVDE